MLAEKVKNIEAARASIYKNGVLVQTWQHEQELRHAMDQVQEFRENLKVWAKEQEKEQKERTKNKISSEYSKRRRSNIAVIIDRVVFISSFLFCCLLLNHSFPTNPNRITNCLKLILLCLQF